MLSSCISVRIMNWIVVNGVHAGFGEGGGGGLKGSRSVSTENSTQREKLHHERCVWGGRPWRNYSTERGCPPPLEFVPGMCLRNCIGWARKFLHVNQDHFNTEKHTQRNAIHVLSQFFDSATILDRPTQAYTELDSIWWCLSQVAKERTECPRNLQSCRKFCLDTGWFWNDNWRETDVLRVFNKSWKGGETLALSQRLSRVSKSRYCIFNRAVWMHWSTVRFLHNWWNCLYFVWKVQYFTCFITMKCTRCHVVTCQTILIMRCCHGDCHIQNPTYLPGNTMDVLVAQAWDRSNFSRWGLQRRSSSVKKRDFFCQETCEWMDSVARLEWPISCRNQDFDATVTARQPRFEANFRSSGASCSVPHSGLYQSVPILTQSQAQMPWNLPHDARLWHLPQSVLDPPVAWPNSPRKYALCVPRLTSSPHFNGILFGKWKQMKDCISHVRANCARVNTVFVSRIVPQRTCVQGKVLVPPSRSTRFATFA